MEVVYNAHAASARVAEARRRGVVVGLVPTMGALHAGHRSLIDRARAECGHVAVSVFVNPLQFGDPHDLAHYPRALEADLAQCRRSGVDTAFVPTVDEMFPGWPAPVPTVVSVRGLADRWEGVSRPGHFDGVATVVAKLFSIAGECRAYFGEKDFQQLAVIRRMAADLSMPVEVIGCPTVREADGLALSSRNVRLSADERRAAPVLSRALAAGRGAVAAGERRPEAVVAAMAAVVATEPSVELDYATVVDAVDLSVPSTLAGIRELRLLVAARVGPVRLIDNCAAGVGTERSAGVDAAVWTGGRDEGPRRGARTTVRRRMMKSKIHRATVTGADLNYVGSISIDPELLAAADIVPFEQVAVLDIENGARFETYAIEGGPGEICLNGAAARLVATGDRVIVLTYADYSEEELATYSPRVVLVDRTNRMVDEATAQLEARFYDGVARPPDSAGRAPAPA